MAKSAWFQKMQFLPLYPFFFIAYPVLALVGININEVEPHVLWRPLITLLFSVSILMLVLRYFMRDWHRDRKSTRLNSSHSQISYAVFCLKKKTTKRTINTW